MNYPRGRHIGEYGRRYSAAICGLDPDDFMIVKIGKRGGLGAIERHAQMRGKRLGMVLKVEEVGNGLARIHRLPQVEDLMK